MLEMCLRDTIPYKDSKHRSEAKCRVVLEIKSYQWRANLTEIILPTHHGVVIHIFVVQDTPNLNHKTIKD